MRIFFVFYSGFLVVKSVVGLFFFLLSVTTAPEDTPKLLREGRNVIAWLNGNPALDLTLLVIGLIGLFLSFGWGNWRLAAHRYFARERLRRLETEARTVAVDIANTISQEKQRRDADLEREWSARAAGQVMLSAHLSQDNRYLSKHMMEAASVIRRLDDVGYWKPADFHHEMGTAGAMGFAAEATCKELYTAADRIKSDLQDGLIALLTQPQPQKGTERRMTL